MKNTHLWFCDKIIKSFQVQFVCLFYRSTSIHFSFHTSDGHLRSSEKVITVFYADTRSSRWFCRKSPSLRVVFYTKTLYLLIPTFYSTWNENDRSERKTHKKNVGYTRGRYQRLRACLNFKVWYWKSVSSFRENDYF